LGISKHKIKRLHIADSAVKESEALLEQELRKIINPQTHVIAPWTGDFHPDHESVGRVATKVARLYGARLTYYFFWLWHQGSLASIEKLPLHIYPISPATLKVKLEALSCHQSQLAHYSGDPILPEALLGPTRRPFEVFLPYD
jgi:LmbE family N-acetylglucosaminyl deacetylase